MLKKILMAIMIAVFLTVGCSTAPPVIEDTRPAHIIRLETKGNRDLIKNGSEDRVMIVKFKENKSMLWIWLDDSGLPKDCDYVVVLSVVDRDKDEYGLMTIFASLDACDNADEAHAAYLKGMEAAKKPQRKDGI